MAGDGRAGHRGAFDAAAADFAALGPHLWEPIGAATTGVAGPGPGDRVLDACCGTGASAIPAARLVGPGGRVDAVDVSGPMIGELRRRCAELPQLHARRADVIAWRTKGYDLVQCGLGIYFFPDVTAGTAHLISRVRPGGRAVFTIWRGESMAAAGRHLGLAVARITNAPAPPPRPPHLVDRISGADAFAAWLCERGLTGVEVTTYEMTVKMTPEVAWLVVLGSGFREALVKLPADAVEAVREAYLTSLGEQGVTELDAATLIAAGRRVT